MVTTILLMVGIAVVSLAIGWLARHRHKKGETKICLLKSDLHNEIRRTCEAAAQGDPDATVKLNDLQRSITEQSIRLTGRPKPPTTVIKGGIV